MVEAAPRGFWNVPNTLTVSRLVLAVLVFVLIANEYYLWALVIFTIAAATDALDGYFARLLKQDTALGRQLDPLVDKVIVAGCYIYLAAIPETGVMPWMVTTIIVRELLIQGLRSHLEGRGQAFGARMAGKLKTVCQCLSISFVLFGLTLAPPQPAVFWWLRDVLTWLAVFLTIYSGLSYVWIALPSFRRDT
jgi:CDP-diacylglycerol---glycerol-3-phosphate 3-phosphatidyltransferase